jgi:hypothetical protein
MMSKMANEFPECPRIHADWEFTLTDKITRELKNTKKFRILVIQNDAQNYQHVAVIISELGPEYVQLPELVGKFLSEIQKTVEVGTEDNLAGKVKVSCFKFTGNIYLYTDKLLVSEDAIRKYFEKNNLVLQTRLIKQNLTF